MKANIKSTYQERISRFESETLSLKKLSLTYSWLRISLFILIITGVVWFANSKDSASMLATLFIGLIVFFMLMKKHSLIKRQLKLKRALKDINQNELKRCELKINGLPLGEQFYNGMHPYHEDLDIYGKHSLFQFINRTSTLAGASKLSDWLNQPAEKNDILLRQNAAREITSNIELRQNFEAFGKLEENEVLDSTGITEWLQSKSKIKHGTLLKLCLAVLPIAMLLCMVLSSMELIPYQYCFIVALVNLGILALVFNPILEITKKTEKGYKLLSSLKEQVKLIEVSQFESELLSEVQKTFFAGKKPASTLIAELHQILDQLQSRANLMYAILDMLFIIDVYWYIKIENWKLKNDIDPAAWFEAIGQFEALSSIAGLAYNEPDFTFPIISDQPFEIDSEKLGHPLIPKEKRVSNDFTFSGQGGVCLITGSNMSGKSTFLRTVGINCVLGLMGAPVCAKHMSLSKLQVFTSMRSKDDLEENVSSFYAELKRLKQLLESINEEIPTLYMIDEVLKGTNSEDRHKGAIALINQLHEAHAFGFVSTHDIELGKITNELSNIKNYSFNSEIKGDEIIFDYRLTDGICKSFNATKLMQLMGIQIPE